MDVVRIGSLGYWNIRIYETTLRVGLWILFFGFLSVGVFGQGSSTIILGAIEGDLEKKQVALDLGTTSKSIAPLSQKRSPCMEVATHLT